MSLPVGTVLVWERAWEREIEPTFAIVLGPNHLKVICGHPQLVGSTNLSVKVHTEDAHPVARNRIAHPDEWPDEVCAKVAELALTGELP